MKNWMKKTLAATVAVTSLGLMSAKASAATLIIICNSSACLVIIIR